MDFLFGVTTPVLPRLTLRCDQTELIKNIDDLIEGGCRRIVGQAPTGFGKTLVAAERLKRLHDCGQRAIFIVPALSLITQTVQRFVSQGITDIGVMQGDHPLTDASRLIQVATAQTLARRQVPDGCGEIIIDECHRMFEAPCRELLTGAQYAHIPIVGLSATPWSKGLGNYYEHLVIGGTTRSMIDAGLLSGFRVFAQSAPDLNGVRTTAGDYNEADLARVTNKVQLVADIVETYQAKGEARPALCFAVDRAHAKSLQEKFIAAGICAEYIDAYTPVHERNKIGDRFHAGEVKVVCNVGTLTTGVDWDVRCVILARPTKSEILLVQMIGRGLRTAEGKTDCLILDHSTTTSRLGFVTDIHYTELDDGKPKTKSERSEPLPKVCPHCQMLRPPKTPKCPNCGFEAKPVAGAYCVAGELVEMTDRRTEKSVSVEERREFFTELRGYGAIKGYTDGWAAHQFKQKFGSFPPWDWNRHDPKEPSPAVRSWIKSRQIAWAKSRSAA
jgi:superfamily II DNA or RNA helicase